MARRVYEGTVNVYWAPAVADISAPTLAELGAATDITCYLTKDGLAVNIATNNVDSAALCETFDAQIPGSWGADIQLTGFRDDYDDVLWDLAVYGTEGYLIVEPYGEPDELPLAGAQVEVYPATMHQKAPANSAANTQQRFTLALPVRSRPDLDAIVST